MAVQRRVWRADMTLFEKRVVDPLLVDFFATIDKNKYKTIVSEIMGCTAPWKSRYAQLNLLLL